MNCEDCGHDMHEWHDYLRCNFVGVGWAECDCSADNRRLSGGEPYPESEPTDER